MNINVILSAKLVGHELQNIFGKIPSALIPFSGHVALDKIYSRSKLFYQKQYIVVCEEKQLIIDHINNRKYNIRIITLDNLSSLGFSVWFALNKIIEENNKIDNLTISFADTIIDSDSYEKMLDSDSFLYTKTLDSERWTTFQNNGQLNIEDKKITTMKPEYNTFIGKFNFVTVSEFNKYLFQELQKDNTENDMDPFFSAIKKYNSVQKMTAILSNDWIDLGHEDRYYEGKKDVATRFFNTIKIDKKRGILKKSSQDKEKFNNEILWYLKLPQELQYLSPRIFDYSLRFENQYIKMEYYGYNTLHETYVYGNLSIDKWKVILNKLFEINTDLNNFQLKMSTDEIKKSLEEVYLNKTLQRLDVLKSNELFNKYFTAKNIIINGIKFENLDYYMNNLKFCLDKSNIYDIDNLNIIHGDYFFANILYDIKGNIVRLIDPRGDFGGRGIYGDNRYDLAKLSHSIIGDYDFIIEDLFELEEENCKITYNIFNNDNHFKVKKLFNEMIKNRYDILNIKLIESLLFLSMIPLHSDYPERQKLMMCIGIQKIDEIMKDMKINKKDGIKK